MTDNPYQPPKAKLLLETPNLPPTKFERIDSLVDQLHVPYTLRTLEQRGSVYYYYDIDLGVESTVNNLANVVIWSADKGLISVQRSCDEDLASRLFQRMREVFPGRLIDSNSAETRKYQALYMWQTDEYVPEYPT